MKKNLLLPLLLLISSLLNSQNSLLWRISGNGLKKPSYLYGTMHLKDKRLFNLSDSLPEAIKQCDLFSLEISPDSMNRLIINLLNAKAENKNEASALSDEDNELIAKKLEKELGMKINKKITIKDLWKFKRYLFESNDKTSQDEKPTFLDGYLSDLAKRMGKETIGLETIATQEALLGKFNLDKKEIDEIKNEITGKYTDKIESLVQAYLKADLNEIEKNYSFFSEDLIYEVLTIRNANMSAKIDSIIKTKSLFAAIGAAHLPGKKGIISLLRGKGYTVEPVLAEKSGSYKNYLALPSKQSWYNNIKPESGLTYSTPGKPELYTGFNILLQMYMYFDIGTGNIYNTLAIDIPELSSEKEMDEKLDAIIHNYETNPIFKVISKQKKYINGIRAAEVNIKSQANYTLKIIARIPRNQIILMVAGQHKNNEHPEDIVKYFNSFQLTEKKIPGWDKFISEEGAFEIMFPGKVKQATVKDVVSEKEVKFYTYNSADSHGNNFIMRYYDFNNGLYSDNDNGVFEQFNETIDNKLEPIHQVKADTNIAGLPAFYCKNSYKDGTQLTYLNILRGQRNYLLMAISAGKDTLNNESKFLNSIRFRAFNQSSLSTSMVNNLAKISLPDKPVLLYNDTLKNDTNVYYCNISYDKNMGNTYFIYNQTVNRYTRFNNDSAYFNFILNSCSEYDSVLSRKETKIGNTYKGEYLLYLKNTRSVKKMNIYTLGNEIFYVFTFLSQEALNNPVVENVFNSVVLQKTKSNFDVYASKASLLLDHLSSPDSLINQKAFDALEYYEFERQDIKAIQKSLLKSFSDDSLSDNTRANLMNSLFTLGDSSLVGFIENNYASFEQTNSSLADNCRTILAKTYTGEAYKLLKSILLSTKKTDNKIYIPIGLLGDSLKLCRTLFPELLSKTDCIDDYSIYRLAVILLDSSILNLSDLKDYLPQLKKVLKEDLNKNDKEDFDLNLALLDILSRESEIAFKDYSTILYKSKNIYNVSNTMLVALKQNYSADLEAISKLAQNIKTRYLLYENLRDYKRLSLFPEKYNHQQTISESELHWSLAYNYELDVEKITFLKEALIDSAGQKLKYLLYKVSYNDENIEPSLGIVGPIVSSKNATITINCPNTGIHDDVYDKKREIEMLEEYLQKQWENETN